MCQHGHSAEYEEVIAAKTTPEIAYHIVEAIARLHTTEFQEVFYHFGLITEDVDDNKFVDCAVAADAEYIVTNDKLFSIFKAMSWPVIEVLSLKEFFVQLLR